ncbi:cytochrome P450 [Catellatospora coxensis]|uniref:Cytochrome P450 n=1 Tax=Catellatospora coxensis TaxID=310354 RepID=A0A8J3LBD4_9ACTN|nr:cytochrome P450 [Catellatospora coxensis]GIG09600.1 cytochrome P450 [Catellatospora coxensis]
MSRPVPGPPPSRWTGRRGNAHAYAADPVAYTARLHHEFGPVSGLVHGDRRQVFAFGAEHNRTVLTGGDVFHTVLEYAIPARIRQARRGIGLLNMNGPDHRAARHTVTPSFRPQAMGRHAAVIARLAAEEVDSWVPGRAFDLTASMRRLTLRIACQCFFGVDIARDADSIGALVQQMLALRYFATPIRYFPFDLPGTPYRRLLTVIRRLDDALASIVDARRSAGEQPDLLQSLLADRDEQGRGLSDDQLVGQLTTLLVAGHETSSSTLSWALILLSQHRPDLDEVLDAAAGRTPEEHAGSTVLDRILKETLRLLPPGPNTARITVAPTMLGEHEIPAWCQVVTSKYVTHRDPARFPEPLRFQPERWETASPTRYEYLPYGAGPHVCIGAAFADLEMKIVLGAILSRHVLVPVPGNPVSREVGLLMSPKGPVPVVAHPVSAVPSRVDRVEGDLNEMVDLYGDERWRLGW